MTRAHPYFNRTLRILLLALAAVVLLPATNCPPIKIRTEWEPPEGRFTSETVIELYKSENINLFRREYTGELSGYGRIESLQNVSGTTLELRPPPFADDDAGSVSWPDGKSTETFYRGRRLEDADSIVVRGRAGTTPTIKVVYSYRVAEYPPSDGWGEYKKPGFLSYVPLEGHVPLHRLYHRTLKDHYYCVTEEDLEEMTAKNYEYEGVVGYVATQSYVDSRPGDNSYAKLYRVYHPGGDHFYTTDKAERDRALTQLGWKIDKGDVGYLRTSSDGGAYKPLYHLYHIDWLDHMYTTSSKERQALLDGEPWLR